MKKIELLDPKYIEIGYRELEIMSPRVRKKLFQFILKLLSEKGERKK